MDRPTLQGSKRKWLKAALDASGLGQAEAARRVEKLNSSMLSAMLNGHKAITDDMVDRIAEGLRMPVPALQLPTDDPSAVAVTIPHGVTLEQVEELLTQGKTTARLLNAVLDRLEGKTVPKPEHQ